MNVLVLSSLQLWISSWIQDFANSRIRVDISDDGLVLVMCADECNHRPAVTRLMTTNIPSKTRTRTLLGYGGLTSWITTSMMKDEKCQGRSVVRRPTDAKVEEFCRVDQNHFRYVSFHCRYSSRTLGTSYRKLGSSSSQQEISNIQASNKVK